MKKDMANESSATTSNAVESASEAPIAAIESTETVALRPLRKRAQEKYPDFKPENDSDWNEKEDEVFSEMEEYNKNYKDAEAQLDKIIETDEELADVLNDMIVNKTPFRVAIAKHYSAEDLIPVDGEEDFEAYEKASKERMDKKAKRDARDAEISKNEQASLDAIDSFATEKGMDEEAKKDYIGFINDTFDSMLMKNLTPNILDAFYNAMNYKADVKSAAEAGEIKGRNASIEAEMAEEEKKASGDGIPSLEKGGAAPEEAPVGKKSVLDDVIRNKRKF